MSKIILVTGATGTLGSRLVKYHLDQGDRVIGLSRCDHKIKNFPIKHDNLFWCMGDIRNNLDSVLPSNGINVVYHCAASKHVDFGEMFPEQYHDVNYTGTINLFKKVNCQRFVFFSTDKAVLPVNFYGMSKAMAEIYLRSMKRSSNRHVDIFRWGNIVGSQGSAIHGWIKQINEGYANITHKDMTRFWLKIDDAVEFATRDDHDRNADVLIHPHIKSASIVDFVAAIAECMGIDKFEFRVTGIRPGEKIHEHLKSDHDSCIRSDTAEKYTHDELLGLVGPIVSQYIGGGK